MYVCVRVCTRVYTVRPFILEIDKYAPLSMYIYILVYNIIYIIWKPLETVWPVYPGCAVGMIWGFPSVSDSSFIGLPLPWNPNPTAAPWRRGVINTHDKCAGEDCTRHAHAWTAFFALRYPTTTTTTTVETKKKSNKRIFNLSAHAPSV